MPVKSINGEIWKDIPNYEGYYQASNLGRVRSLDRIVTFSNGRKQFYKGKLIKGSVNNGYRQTALSSGGIGRNFKFSQLVAITFLGHEPNGHELVIDHVNGDKSDDRVKNLRIVTQRANTSTCFRSDKDSLSSEYAGVYWNEKVSKWQSQIQHDGAKIYLGLYNTEVEASTAYQSALSKIKDGSFNYDDYKPKWTSKYKGVYFAKSKNKWKAYIKINGKQKHLGYHPTEFEAHQAYQSALYRINEGSFNLDDYNPKYNSEHKGVSFNKARNKWFAYITISGKTKYLGSFTTELEAHQAYQTKLKELQII